MLHVSTYLYTNTVVGNRTYNNIVVVYALSGL